MCNKGMPKVSVCVITYNHKKYIRHCLDSILDQETNATYEIIVADDASDDGTTEIIKEYAFKYPDIIKPIFHEDNVGVYQNYKDAHMSAAGIYVAHCDGDDYWYKNKLETQVRILDADQSIVQCWSGADIVDDNGTIKRVFPSKWARKLYPKNLTSSDIALSYALVGQHSTQVYRRKFQPNYSKEEFLDYWVAFKLSLNGKSHYLTNESLGAYRCTSSPSLTRHSGSRKVAVDLLSEHLYSISVKYPQFSLQVKANIITRLIFSKLKKHQTDNILFYMKQMSNEKISVSYVMKSIFYFLLQKVS